jgi:phosphoglycolate phosphatase
MATLLLTFDSHMADGLRYRAILFDWDGTLLDSWAADAQGYMGMFRALGIPWGPDELQAHYSPNWHQIYWAARIPRRRWKEADQLWLRSYAHDATRLVPGARNILESLRRRFTLGLVTSGSRRRVLRQIHSHKLFSFFVTRIFCEDVRQRKPHPAPLRLALKRLRLSGEECVYVGDSPEDMEMAHRAGVRAAAILGPSPTRHTVAAALPDVLLASLSELPRWLRKSELPGKNL